MLWKINIEKPVSYYKCGQFVGTENWKHKRMCLDKDFEVMIGLKGEVFIQVGQRHYSLKHGEVLIVPPGVEYFGDRASVDGASFFWIHFFPSMQADSFLEEDLISHLMGTEIPMHRAAVNHSIFLPDYFKLSFPDKPLILMKQILDTANGKYYSTLAVDYLVTELLIELTDQYSKQILQNKTIQSGNTQKFTQILEWIRVNIYDEELSVRKIADTFAFNPDHLTRMFKRNIGMSTVKYMNTLKLNLAKELLCTTNKSIKEIAYDLNFKDRKYFMRLFKNYEEMTPSQFRDAYTKTYLNTISVDPDIPMPEHLAD